VKWRRSTGGDGDVGGPDLGPVPPEPSDPGGPAGVPRRSPAGASFTRSMLGAFARGTGLVAVALAIGIVLLQWSDASTDAAAGGRPPVVGTPAAPGTTATSATTATTGPAGPRPPSALTVLVLNGSGRNNQAKPMSDRLTVVGYRTLTPGTVAQRADSVVLCRPGLEREALALAAATGLPARSGTLDAATAAAFPGAGPADCVVAIGAR
jgi:hypothetical protein